MRAVRGKAHHPADARRIQNRGAGLEPHGQTLANLFAFLGRDANPDVNETEKMDEFVWVNAAAVGARL